MIEAPMPKRIVFAELIPHPAGSEFHNQVRYILESDEADEDEDDEDHDEEDDEED